MRTFVALVICALVALPSGASASTAPRKLVREASRLSGLPARRQVQTAVVSAKRYDVLFTRAWSREYPPTIRRTDASVYRRLGLVTRAVKFQSPRAWYDISARRLFVQRGRTASRPALIQEVVRALVDQNYGLRRLVGLRARPRPLARSRRDRPRDGCARVGTAPPDGPWHPARPLLGARGVGRSRPRSCARSGAALPRRPVCTRKRAAHVPGDDGAAPARRQVPRTRTRATGPPARACGRRRPRRFRDVRRAGPPLPAAGVPGPGRRSDRPRLGRRTAGLVRRRRCAGASLGLAGRGSRVAGRGSGVRRRCVPGRDLALVPAARRCWAGPGELAAGVYGTTAVFASGPGSAAVAAALLTVD